MTHNRGIDYGLGKTNTDVETNIRFGVIHSNHLADWLWDSFQPDYGEPCCPKCGSEVCESPYGKDYFCENCFEVNDSRDPEQDEEEREDHEDYCYWSEEVYPDKALCWYIDDGDYVATLDEMGDIFITKSPYYTHAQFCSPCAPGACYITNPTPEGEKAYCFGPNWFEDGEVPYPIYCVKTGKLVKHKEV